MTSDDEELGGSRPNKPADTGRIFLCVVDDSPELGPALRFACRRAKHTGGRVALLYVIEPAEFQHWMAVEHLMAEERREEAEEMLQVVSSVVQQRSGTTPVIYIREGKLTEELMSLIAEQTGVSVLVLGAESGKSGPGRLIDYVVKRAGKLPVPVTMVPGNLTDEQIDAIT